MHPTQEISEERPDGSLIVTYRVGHLEGVKNMLKSWIPHVLILDPEELKADLVKDVKEWVERQEGLPDTPTKRLEEFKNT